jgi:ketosteroid isomerase-like protein
MRFEIVDLTVIVGEDQAMSYGFNHIQTQVKTGVPLDMYWRETLGWAKKRGQWKIVHAHSSVPFDAGSGKASIGLKP